MSENNVKKPVGRRTMGGPRPMGGPGALMPGEKAKDFKGTMKKLLSYLGRYKITIIIVFTVSFRTPHNNPLELLDIGYFGIFLN